MGVRAVFGNLKYLIGAFDDHGYMSKKGGCGGMKNKST